jgi:hypothetical protein
MIVSKLVQTAMAMVSLTKIRTNVNALHAVALVLYLMTTAMKTQQKHRALRSA